MQDVQMNSKTRHCELYMVISWRRGVGDVCKIIHRLGIIKIILQMVLVYLL